MNEGSAHERIWAFYLMTAAAMVLVGGGLAPSGSASAAWWDAAPAFLAIHLALLATVLALPRVVRGRWERAVARGAFTLLTLPAVYYSLALVLPAVHPEPFEYTWIAADRALLGTDPTVAAQALLWPPFVEVLQLCYAVFYLVPVVAVLGSARAGGLPAYERGLDVIVLGFGLSYLGYLIWPTLPPYRFLFHESPLEGVLLAGRLHEALDVAEVHRWNCFPSGHTMVSVLSLAIAWRHARRAFWLLLPIVTLLVLSTVVLRYHYVVDVLAGLAGAALTLALLRERRVPGAPLSGLRAQVPVD